jgi:RNA polymerase sigma factor (sigma-70 family)
MGRHRARTGPLYPLETGRNPGEDFEVTWDQDNEGRGKRPRDDGSDGGDDGWDEDDAALYARFSGTLLSFFRNKVASNSAADAMELMHETFVRFIAKRARGPIVDKQGRRFREPRACLFGIARNVLLEHLRKLVKANDIDEITEMSVADMGRGLSSQISLAEKQALIHELLRELPFYQQIVIESCVYQEMSYQEVATFLDIPLGTVATLGRQGRGNLRKWFRTVLSHHPLPRFLVEEDADRGRETLAEYTWYDPLSGSIDDWKLLGHITRSRSEGGPLPEWFAKLEIPRQLLGACATELYALARSVWEAWRDAGRPALQGAPNH